MGRRKKEEEKKRQLAGEFDSSSLGVVVIFTHNNLFTMNIAAFFDTPQPLVLTDNFEKIKIHSGALRSKTMSELIFFCKLCVILLRSRVLLGVYVLIKDI